MDIEEREKIIGQNIRKCREEMGLTQEKLLDLLSMSASSVAHLRKWEKGSSIPSMQNLHKLCEVFQCDFGFLVGDYPEKRRVTADVCTQTGLSEHAAEKLMKYKNDKVLYPGCAEAMSSLLESRSGDEVLRKLFKFKTLIPRLAELLEIEAEAYRTSRLSEGEWDNYPNDFSIAHDNRVEFEAKVDLLEYKLDTQFRYLLEELREKAEGKEKIKNGKSDRTPG